MKRCPECRRDYYDDTLLYCLDDGNALLEGPAKSEPPVLAGGQFDASEPATAIIHTTDAVGDAPTRAQIHTTGQTAVWHGSEAEPQRNLGDSSEKQSFSANRAAKPLVIFGVVGLLLIGGFFGYRYLGSNSKQIESIAVMPFVNESGSADVEYLSDGMTETLINSLSQLPNLKVMSRNSVFHYKGKDTDAQAVAKELKVQAVLTGRVTQRGDGLSINVELVNALDGRQLWGQQYNRKLADVFAVQEEIAKEISEKLRSKLTGAERQQLAKRPTENIKAFQYYM